MKKIENNAALAVQECAELAKWIEQNKELLIDILLPIESQETVNDEIFKSIDALNNVTKEGISDFMPVGNGATFFPINLPFYSLVIFGIIPGIFAEKMFIRPPELMRGYMKRIFAALPKMRLTQGLELCNCDRTEFMEDYVDKSKFVLFTGTLKNANIIRKKIRKDQVFIFNGQGINPVVISADANIALAVDKTCEVKRFNSGQDCAAADSIFVHADVYEAFKEKLVADLDQLHVGAYKEGATIGPLADPSHTLIAAEHLFKWRHSIGYGGQIDIHNAIAKPTIVECATVEDANLKELFSPIWHLCKYETEEDLRKYFDQPAYREYAMYVSLFGTSAYLAQQQHTIVLEDQIIMDVERGNKEYGGYSIGASFVQFNGKTEARPILISREIKRAFFSVDQDNIDDTTLEVAAHA